MECRKKYESLGFKFFTTSNDLTQFVFILVLYSLTFSVLVLESRFFILLSMVQMIYVSWQISRWTTAGASGTNLLAIDLFVLVPDFSVINLITCSSTTLSAFLESWSTWLRRFDFNLNIVKVFCKIFF